MRIKAALAALGAGGVLLAAAPASALPCPPGTQWEPARVGVVWVTACWPRLDVQP